MRTLYLTVQISILSALFALVAMIQVLLILIILYSNTTTNVMLMDTEVKQQNHPEIQECHLTNG